MTPTLFALGYDIRLLAAAGIAFILFFAIPSTRRAARTSLEQLAGFLDATLLRNRSERTASLFVAVKIDALVRATEAQFQRLIARYNRRSRDRMMELREARRKHRNAAEDLDRVRAVSRNKVDRTLDDDVASISAAAYFTAQTMIGIFDLFFTYFAFELWQLPTLALAPLAVLLGAVGVVIGHFLGQSVILRQRQIMLATVFAAIGYCIVIGTARFGYVAAQTSNHGAATAIGSYGIPAIVIFASALLATQLRARSTLQASRDAEDAARVRADEAFRAGLLAADDMYAKMRQRRARTLELIAVYCMGFRQGWRDDKIEFPADPVIQVPSFDWPPAGFEEESIFHADRGAALSPIGRRKWRHIK